MPIGAHKFDPRPAGTYAGKCTHCGGTAVSCTGTKGIEEIFTPPAQSSGVPATPDGWRAKYEAEEIVVDLLLRRGDMQLMRWIRPMHSVLETPSHEYYKPPAPLEDEHHVLTSLVWGISAEGTLKTKEEDTRTPEVKLFESVQALLKQYEERAYRVCLFCGAGDEVHVAECPLAELQTVYEEWKAAVLDSEEYGI